MTAAVRKVLQDFASGIGAPFGKVHKHYNGLTESERFAFLRGCRELEMQHRQYLRDRKAFRKTLTPVLYRPDGEEI